MNQIGIEPPLGPKGSSPAEHDGAGRRVRPYAITSGRTRPLGGDLPVEALVQRTAMGGRALPTAHLERRRILELTAEPLAVAEVSALLRLHLGVTAVLLGDLVAEDLVIVYLPPAASASRVDLVLLERVLQGLRSL